MSDKTTVVDPRDAQGNVPEDKTPASSRWLRRGIRVWAIIGIILVIAAAVFCGGMISYALSLLLGGVVLGFICSPVTNWLEDRGLSRAAGAGVALLLVIVVIIGMVLVIVPPFVEQTIELLRRVPDYAQQLQGLVRDIIDDYGYLFSDDASANIKQLMSSAAGVLSDFAQSGVTTLSSGIITNVVGLGNGAIALFLSFILAYWFAKDYPVMVREITNIAGPDRRKDILLMLAITSRSTGAYMRSVAITSVVNGLLAAVGLMLCGHPYASLMGIFVGILHVIPVVGPFISAAMATVLAIFAGPVCVIWTIVITMVAQNVTDNVIAPFVMRSAVNVHPAVSLVAIFVGNCLGGIVGMVLAVPLSAALKGVFIYYFETRTKRPLVSPDGALFGGTPYTTEDGDIIPAFDALDDDKFFEHSRLVSPEEGIAVMSAPKSQVTLDMVAQTITKQVSKFKKQEGDK